MAFADWVKRSNLAADALARLPRVLAVLQAAYKAGERQGRKDVEALAKNAKDLDWLCYRQALENANTNGARRHFVLGAKWWQAHKNGATAFASEVDEMEREALSRYGLPCKFTEPSSEKPIAWIDAGDLRGICQGNAAWVHPEDQGRMVPLYVEPERREWLEYVTPNAGVTGQPREEGKS